MEKVLKYLEGDSMYLTRKISLHVSNYHSVKYLMELFLSTSEYQEYPIGYEYCLDIFMRMIDLKNGTFHKDLVSTH